VSLQDTPRHPTDPNPLRSWVFADPNSQTNNMSIDNMSSYFAGGVFTTLTPSAPPPSDDVTGDDVDAFPGYCKSGAMVQYGSLGIFRVIAQHSQIPTPVLNSLTSSWAAFGNCLKKISDFYSDPKSDPISAEDAFNLLRLHVHGGGLKRWVEGLKTGVFATQDGVIIGKTKPKSGLHLEKNENGRWERPQWLHTFSAEMTKACNKLCSLNVKLLEEFCSDVEDTYQRQSRFVNHVVSLVQATVMVKVQKYLIERHAYELRITPSTVIWKGGDVACGELFDELSAACADLQAPSGAAVTFGPMAMPFLAPPVVLARNNFFAGLGKRKAAEPLTDSPPLLAPL